jgi:putative membrane protein
MNDSVLPHLNAGLNAVSFVLLLVGFYFIRRGRIAAHRATMVAALAVSGLFLVSYVVYHYNYGSVRFTGQGFVRPVYFVILITHVILAAAIVPLVALTVTRAVRGDYPRHRRIARWTYPLWLYVSVTGVVVYLMLYQLYSPAGK